MFITKRSILAVCAGIAVAGAISTAGPVSAGPSDQVIRLDAQLAFFHKTDYKPKGDSAGDAFQFGDKLSTGGAPRGKDFASCVHADKVYYECTWTLALPDGTIQLNGRARDTNAGYELPIVGGSGAYARARGSVVVTDALKKVAHYTATYALG